MTERILDRKLVVSLGIFYTLSILTVFLTGLWLGRRTAPVIIGPGALIQDTLRDKAAAQQEKDKADLDQIAIGFRRKLEAAEPAPTHRAAGSKKAPTINSAKQSDKAQSPSKETPGERSEPQVAGGDHYTIQVAATTDPAEAKKRRDALSAKGFAARVETDGKWHRVRIGRYGSMADARAEKRRLQKALPAVTDMLIIKTDTHGRQ